MSRVGTRYHLAVADGPDTGWVTPIPDRITVVIGRSSDADLSLADPALSRRHVAVRMDRGTICARRFASAPRVSYRPRRRRWSRRRRLGSRWRRVRVGAQFQLGTTTIELRDHPGFQTPPVPKHRSDGLRLLIPIAMAATMIPLALSGTSTLRAITWMVLPVVMVAAVLWPWLRERAQRRLRGDPGEPEPTPPPDPAQLLAATERRCLTRSWDVGGSWSGGLMRQRLVTPAAIGQGIGLVGPDEAVRAMARWLLCQLAYLHTPEQLQITAPPSWDWAAPLPHSKPRREQPEQQLIVYDHCEPQPAPRLPAQASAILCATSLAQIPSWCSQVVEVAPDHARLVSIAWANEACTDIAAAAESSDPLPTLVSLQELTPSSPQQIAARWQHRSSGLECTIALGPNGPVHLDLASSGPHALVAGTTGSGKSELLTTWVLSLAMEHAPADLNILLIDYKGGATFATLAALPHVIDVLTDLDTSTTARALASLRAEVARRERVLAESGTRSLTELRNQGSTMPRLLVMVDEFRTLADTHPELLDGLVRLAAQGRSLGIHLVLATQRPAGAVTADMRANISLRICLQVLEPTDSLDVLGDTSATTLPSAPGRAILKSEDQIRIQVAWPGTIDEGVPALVHAIQAATDLGGEPSTRAISPPWAPALPTAVSVDELDCPEQALALLLLDLPDQQRHASWQLQHGQTLLISGPPGAGRSTAARTLATQAVQQGVVTDVLANTALAPAAPALGTVCGLREVRRGIRLLSQIADMPPSSAAHRMLVIDDVDVLCQDIDNKLGFGRGTELVSAAVRAARGNAMTVVLTCGGRPNSWANQVRSHLVLTPRDAAEAMAAGIPRTMLSSTTSPGRGVLLAEGEATAAQVAQPSSGGHYREPDQPPQRLLALPLMVSLPATTGSCEQLLIGLGGDHAGPVTAPLAPTGTWLVLGAARSGRSTTLAMLAQRLAAGGRTVWPDAQTALAQVSQAQAGVVMIDDAERLSPSLASRLSEMAQRSPLAVIAAARPEPLGSAFHDLARRLRDPDATLVLGTTTAVTNWTGIDLRPFSPPTSLPGHGVLVTAGEAVPVTVDRGPHRVGPDPS
ncbi:MAG: FtsK/SpoIIIE domain-containing protein [Beutenbergiaceae bacterium]